MTDHITPSEVATRFNMSRTSVYRAIHRGELPAQYKKAYKGRKGRYRIDPAEASRIFNGCWDAYEHNHASDSEVVQKKGKELQS